MYSLTLDLGSTFFKASVFNNYDLVGMAAVRCPTAYPALNQAEIDPEIFKKTIANVLAELKQNWPKEFASCTRLSFASQANSFVLLGQSGEALRPIIVWTDVRASQVDDPISNMYGAAKTYAVTGMPKISRQMMPVKLHWISKNQPEVWRKARYLCSISDYLTFWLTGEHLSEAGAAALTGMVDIHKLKWTEQSIDVLDLDHIKLPRIVRGGQTVGKLRSKVASELGIHLDCQFVMGCLDQYAGAIGAGNTKIGAISETTGTVMATVSLAENFNAGLQHSAVIQGPAFAPGQFYRMVAGDVSANLIEKYREEKAPEKTYQQLDALASGAVAGLDNKTGVLTKDMTDGQQMLLIYKRIAAALAKQVSQVAPDHSAREIFCVGGAAASDCLLKLKAGALDIATVALKCAQPTSLGAAVLAQSDTTPVENVPKPKIRARFESK